MRAQSAFDILNLGLPLTAEKRDFGLNCAMRSSHEIFNMSPESSNAGNKIYSTIDPRRPPVRASLKGGI
jgi:hypothetical protein